MPRPLSATVTSTPPPGVVCAERVTWPRSVNLSALWIRLRTTVFTLCASVSIIGRSPGRSSRSSTSARPQFSGSCWKTRSEEHTSELQSLAYLVCRLLLEKKKKQKYHKHRTCKQR